MRAGQYFCKLYLASGLSFFLLEGTTSSSSFRGTIPFSTKYPELIIPNERVCLPRISCKKEFRKFVPNTRTEKPPLYTDYIDSKGGIDGAGPVQLPPDADRPDNEIQYDDDNDLQAVQSEADNYLIDQSEEACIKDKEDYCDQDRVSDYLGAEHTMCKYCGIGSACPYHIDSANNDLTGRGIESNEVKELIVQLHNEVRSKIARGACDQPKAGCMGPVVWDDELARVAQKWADQCADVDYKDDYKRKDPHLFHDPHPQRKVADFSDWQGVGQNVARDIAPGEMGKFNATKLVGHWFRQIRFFDPKGVEEFGSGNQCSLGVGYYTQLVWQNTTHVGCGWSQFQYRGFAGYFENFLVCNYGPSANIWKDPVYSIAKTTCDCPCVDCDQEEGMCPSDPRYGSWAGWSKWGSCSKSCGGGVRQRTRPCRAPKEGGGTEPCNLCKGEGDEKETCNNYKCPFWSEWAPWSQCSVTCGNGERTRSRTCDGPSFRLSFERLIGGELPCPGAPEEREKCEAGPCPAWTEWTKWTECSQSCGGGTRTKLRECAEGRNYGGCVGESEVIEDCNEQTCPAWTEWTKWTVCTKSCGGGKKTKVRECVLPKSGNGGIQCNGSPEVTEDCNEQSCPDWTDWSKWTECTRTCGGGQKSRQRDCLLNYERGSNDFGCIGESDETDACNDNQCPIWTEWSDWTECSATCGGGVQVRARDCVLPKERISGCIGDKEESRECNSNVCPVWTNWTNWTECTTTCGGGTKFKVRECIIPDVRNVQQCPGPDKISEDCNANPCPSLTEWSDWSECSQTCGGGTKSKRRECVYPRNSIKNDCLERLEISETCNEQVCPAFTEWTDWTECTKTCGGGVRKKVRECALPKSVAGCFGDSELEEACNEQSCPVWTDWTEWTECTKTCDGGNQRRERKCVLAKEKSGLSCPGPEDEERKCNLNRCPIWTDWTEWTPCTKTCNSGIKTKLRECIIPKSGNQSICEGESLRNEVCNTQECPSWTDWTDWTSCTQTCGGGTRSKVRECVLPKSGNSPTLCAGEKEETEECNVDTCPDWTDWTEWTPCTQTCGGGKKKRSRECIALRNGETSCDGDSEEVVPCNEENCPDFSKWSAWTPCSKSCGGGVRDRERECQVDGESVCTCQCFGPIQEFESCSQDQCPEWGDWSRWSSCSVSCGEGTQTRDRSCTGVGECPGEKSEERECKERSCPKWSPWGDWSSCSASCGEGIRDRVRKCGSSARYSESCPGDSSEAEVCDSGTCKGWSNWEPWSECSASCEGGVRERNRKCGPLDRNTNTCVGDTTETEDCDNGSCSQWGSWEGWSQCSASCGQGLKQRKRSCQPRNGNCPGEDNEQDRCQAESGPCPGWSTWGSWSGCSATCGEGTQTRERACGSQFTRLGLLTSSCPGASQDSKRCSLKECESLPPAEECNGIVLPSGFSSFNGRPANNVADCTWDYFSCTNNYGTWPNNKDCCDQRFNQCCMLVMNWQPTTHKPVISGGYGPSEPEIDIDIENDLDLPNLENPIDDIDLGDGQSIKRPGVSPVIVELDPEELCAGASSDLIPHPSDCSKYISCQPGGSKWILNIRDCSPGTVFDTRNNQCNFKSDVPRCQSGRRARVSSGFESEELNNFVDTGNGIEFLKVFEEVNKVFAKQTVDRLNVADSGFISAQALVSKSSATVPNLAVFLITSLLLIKLYF